MNLNLLTTSLYLQNITLKINNKNNLKLKLKEIILEETKKATSNIKNNFLIN